MNPGFKTGFAVALGVIAALFVFSIVSGMLRK
jgi:hypothetical protein